LNVTKNIINREVAMSGERFEFFLIRVRDFQTLGDDIDQLIMKEQLYNKTIFMKIERYWEHKHGR